jgi:hypothetical protein
VSREELRWLFDTDLVHDRTYRCADAGDCLLGLKYVDNAEAVLAPSGNVNQEALEREVEWRLHAALAVREPANDFLVFLRVRLGIWWTAMMSICDLPRDVNTANSTVWQVPLQSSRHMASAVTNKLIHFPTSEYDPLSGERQNPPAPGGSKNR